MKRGISISELREILSLFPAVGASFETTFWKLILRTQFRFLMAWIGINLDFGNCEKTQTYIDVVGNPDIGHHGDEV